MTTNTFHGVYSVHAKDSHLEIRRPRHYWWPFADRVRNVTIDSQVDGATALQQERTLSLTNYRGTLTIPSEVKTDLTLEGAVKLSGTHPGGSIQYSHATVEGTLESPLPYKTEMHPIFAGAKGIAEDAGYMCILAVPSLAILAGVKYFTGINMGEHLSWALVIASGAYVALNPHDRRATMSGIALFLALTFGDDVLNLRTKGLDSFSIQDVWNTAWFGAGNILGYIARKYLDGFKS